MNRSSLCQAACENDQVSVNDITIKSKVDSYIIDGTDLNCLNTTGVTNMKEIFKDSIDFDGNLSCWDTSSVTNMEVSAKQLNRISVLTRFFAIIRHLKCLFVVILYSFTL